MMEFIMIVLTIFNVIMFIYTLQLKIDFGYSIFLLKKRITSLESNEKIDNREGKF